jgi:hypothetical protein
LVPVDQEAENTAAHGVNPGAVFDFRKAQSRQEIIQKAYFEFLRNRCVKKEEERRPWNRVLRYLWVFST